MAFSKPSSSSSFSVPTGGWTYDVFLSFRGEDTRFNFVDHLYTALVQRGICVFKDDETLCREESISPELLKAIKESRFAAVVFSENYAKSHWCLEELAKIMESHEQMGQKVLPVSYYVDPSDVRGQKSDFATAFAQQEDKSAGEMDKVNKWREALTAAASLSGFPISKTLKEGESAIITKIVQEILGGIPPRCIEKSLIDIESRIDELYKLLDMDATNEVLMVGICGMGGIGKTTIANAMFRRISYRFEGSCFVKDVRQNSSSERNICALQEKMLRELAVPRHHWFVDEDPHHGAYMIQEIVCNKKVLLVLDDVDEMEQLEFLAASHDWFGAGSRIIITTRDEHLLSDADVKYKPDFLLMDQALELFSMNAFRQSKPPEGYEELSMQAVYYTSGLPLALKVFRSFFHGRQARVWKNALDRLQIGKFFRH